MYRVIKASTIEDVAEIKDAIKAIKADIRILSRVDTYEDMYNQNFQYYHTKFIIGVMERKLGSSPTDEEFDDWRDSWIESYYQLLNKTREECQQAIARNESSPKLFNDIVENLENQGYVILKESDEYIKVEANGSVVDFVDTVVDAVKGHYYGTGRGGSWTKWDITTPSGVQLKAGWDYEDDNNWCVERIR